MKPMNEHDKRFVEKWQNIYAERHLHAEIEALRCDHHRLVAVYLGRAAFHAYHAEIAEYVEGREAPDGGFNLGHNEIPVFLDAAMMDDEVRPLYE